MKPKQYRIINTFKDSLLKDQCTISCCFWLMTVKIIYIFLIITRRQ